MIDGLLEEETTQGEEQAAHGYFKPALSQDPECKHLYWMKRCSMCKAIMASDSQHNVDEGESQRVVYNELDSLVCTRLLSTKLKELKVIQKSRLYWVTQEEEKIVALRCHETATKLRGMTVISAFTTSELARHLLRLPRKYHTPQMFQYVGRNAHDPNRLARLLIKILKSDEQTQDSV